MDTGIYFYKIKFCMISTFLKWYFLVELSVGDFANGFRQFYYSIFLNLNALLCTF